MAYFIHFQSAMFEDVNECTVKSMTLAEQYLFQCHNNNWPLDHLQFEHTGGRA